MSIIRTIFGGCFLLALAGQQLFAQGIPLLKGSYYSMTFSQQELEQEIAKVADQQKKLKKAAKKKEAAKKQQKKKSAKTASSSSAPEEEELPSAELLAKINLAGGILQKYITTQDESIIAPYAVSDNLYTSSFYQPLISSAALPALCKQPDKKPSAQFFVYKGTATAPESGSFRFVGAGSDFIIVRFDGKIVLQAGDWLPTLYRQDAPLACRSSIGSKHLSTIAKGKAKDTFADYRLISDVPGIPTWNRRQGGLMAGEPFQAAEGKSYPIEVITGSCSQDFGFVLYIENADLPPEDHSKRPLFTLNYNLPNIKALTDYIRSINAFRKTADGEASHSLEAPPFADAKDTKLWFAAPKR